MPEPTGHPVRQLDERCVNGYDRLAAIYRPLEFLMFGGNLQAARVALLDSLPEVNRALILGDGDGRLLQALLHHQPACSITSVDGSSKMLDRQQERLGMDHRVQFVQGDARTLPEPQVPYDLLVTPFFLDCFSPSDLHTHLRGWLSMVRSGGLFYFVDFVLPPAGWQRTRAKARLKIMHLFFRWQTGLQNRCLPDWDQVFQELPLQSVAVRQSPCGMICSSIYQVLPGDREPHRVNLS